MHHPPLEELRSASPERTQHLTSCPDCRRLVELLGAVAQPAPASTGQLVDVPVVDRAVFAEWEELTDTRGGMGRLFRAWDRRLGRYVAVKQIRPAATPAQQELQLELVRRLEQEARLTARLQHPSIVAVYEVGRFPDGELFYAMPLVRGRPLSKEIVSRGTLAERIALLPQLTAVAEAVAYSHEEGVIHRDLKPDNILVGAFGEAVLIDWGLAKSLAEVPHEPALVDDVYRAEDDGLTRLGAGTPHYMSPEQARGEAASLAMDVYALGATLHHTLAGEPAYGAADAREVRRRLQAALPPTPLTERVPDVPAELAHIVERAMARDPAARYASARAFADELHRFQTGRLLQSRRYSLGELVRHFVRRHRVALSVAATSLALLVGISIAGAVSIRRQRDRAEEQRGRAESSLRRAQGVIATRLAPDAARRLEAIGLGVRAVGPELVDGERPAPEAFQGLLDALTAGPAAVALDHGGAVTNFAVSSDGNLLAGIGDDHALVVWNARSGRQMARFTSTLAVPYYVRFSPAGDRLAVCGGEPNAELFELASGRRRTVTTQHGIAGCEFTADGSFVVASDEIGLYDPATGALRSRYRLPVPAARLAVAGARIAVATIDGSLSVTVGDGRLRVVAGAGSAPASLAFDRDGERLLLVAVDGVARVFTRDGDSFAATVLPLRSDLASRNAQGRFSPDGRFATIAYWSEEEVSTLIFDVARAAPLGQTAGFAQAWADGDRFWADARGTFVLVDAHSGARALAVGGHHDEIKAAAWLGDAVATASRDGDELLWDLRDGEASGLLLGHTAEVVAAAVAADDRRMVTASRDGTVRVWSLPDGRVEHVWRTPAALATAAWSPDGSAAVAGGLDGTVRLLASDGSERAVWHAGGPITAARFFPDAERIAVGALDGSLAVVSRDGGTHILRSDGGAVTAVAIASSGRTLLSAHADGSVRLWDVAAGAERARLPGREPVDEPSDHEGASAVAFAGEDRALVSRASGKTWIVDAHDLTARGELAGRAASAASETLTRDGRRYAAVLPDGGVAVHDLVAGTTVTLRGHRGIVLATAFSRDGERLATGGLDGTVCVWDLTSGRELARINASLGPTTAVAFGHDRDFVLAGYGSGALRRHPVTKEAAVARACVTLRRFERVDAELARYCAPARTTKSAKRSTAR